MFDPEDIIAMAQRQRKIQLLEQAQGGRRGGVTGEQLGAFIGGVLGYVVLIFVCGGIGGAIVFGLFASGLIDDGFESAEGCAIERNDREQIVEVSATNVELTDEALGRLCSMGLENVRTLVLSGSWVQVRRRPLLTDKGLVHLKGMDQLEDLDLSGNRGITDAGLVHLKGLSNLIRLDLTDTEVTKEGHADLKQALPNCGISLEWDKLFP